MYNGSTRSSGGVGQRGEFLGLADGGNQCHRGGDNKAFFMDEDALVRDGVSASAITVIGMGEKGLLVPTGDGVREPQNRRVEIVIQ